MAAAIGQVSLIAVATSVLTLTTAGINTSASGSAFEVVVVTNGANGATAPTVTDNKGNTYTAIGAVLNNTNTENVWRFYTANGTGGAGHTFTATFAGSLGTLEIMGFEMTGLATSPLDQSNTGTNGASTGPAASGNITVAPPANQEILVSVMMAHSASTNLTFAEANTFIIQATQGLFATAATQWAVGTKIVSASSTYAASWSWGGANIFVCSCIDSFKGAAAGGGGGGIGTGGMINSGKWLWSKRR